MARAGCGCEVGDAGAPGVCAIDSGCSGRFSSVKPSGRGGAFLFCFSSVKPGGSGGAIAVIGWAPICYSSRQFALHLAR